MQLLERFYDPTSGSVLVDGIDLQEYNLQDYRAQLAIVSQETTLYTGTIRENILADREDMSEESIVQACKDANIYEFIMSLPDGFATLVGAKGALVSFWNDSFPNLPGLIDYVARLKGTAKLRPDSKLSITRDWATPRARLNGALQLSKGLAKIAA